MFHRAVMHGRVIHPVNFICNYIPLKSFTPNIYTIFKYYVPPLHPMTLTMISAEKRNEKTTTSTIVKMICTLSNNFQ